MTSTAPTRANRQQLERVRLETYYGLLRSWVRDVVLQTIYGLCRFVIGEK